MLLKVQLRDLKKNQRKYYSGKKKRHTLKTQLVVEKESKKIMCTSFEKGKVHDFRILKESEVKIAECAPVLVDSGYQGLQKLHGNTTLPHKRRKKQPLTKEQRSHNKKLASNRVLNENVIGILKRFKIIADRYRNRRKRFNLRFNLISGIYNFELGK